MSFFADIYVAARSRDAHWITTLLDTFLGPSRSTSTGSLLVEGVEVDAPDEFVPLSDLETVTKTLIKVILDFCGYE